MKLKASLHIHTSEDKSEGYFINYDVYELIDRAAELKFDVLGLTCHKKFIYHEKFEDHAKNKGILLIFGVELSIGLNALSRFDMIVLNIEPNEAENIEKINSLSGLDNYKKLHPDIFILVPHPFHYRLDSIGEKKMLKNIDLFDAIEHHWFYHKLINPNKKAFKIAERFKKPFIATADLHNFDYFSTDYVIVEAEKLDCQSFFSAIKSSRYANISRVKTLMELFSYIIKFKMKELFLLPNKVRHLNKINEILGINKSDQIKKSNATEKISIK